MEFKKPITKKQKEVLTFILRFISENGYSPALKEVATYLQTNNLSTAQYFVRELEGRGYLKKTNHAARGIQPITNTTSIPLLGVIAAGKPIEPIENPEEIEVPSSIKLSSRYSHYALKIKGDSMIDMGILNDDVVLIQHQMTANVGDVVVAITENGATLKVLKEINEKKVLEPRNLNYPTIFPRQLEIRGKFIGLIRT